MLAEDPSSIYQLPSRFKNANSSLALNHLESSERYKQYRKIDRRR